MLHKHLEEKLQKISAHIKNDYQIEESIGVIAGISGCALFQFYYSKYLNVNDYSDIGVEMISHCVDKINAGYSFPTYCNGIAGFGWAIQHLEEQNFVELDCDELLEPFDEYLHNQMMIDFKNKNYDFLHGGIGYGFYFLKRYQSTKIQKLRIRYKNYLLECVGELGKLAEREGKTFRWASVLDSRKGNVGYNLSLSHGMSSILNYLSRLYEFEEFKEVTKDLIIGCVEYILRFEDNDKNNISLFPSWVEVGKVPAYMCRLAWCYGDFGVGISILRAAKVLRDDKLEERAWSILMHTTKRRSKENTLVVDAGVCHGSYGNAQVFQLLHGFSGQTTFKEAQGFWMEDGEQRANHTKEYLGYRQWSGLSQSWEKKLSLLEGISGIGLVMIDYLSKKPNSWDECLMLS